MILGIGVDCVRVDRMEKSLARPSFLERVFSSAEQEMLGTRKEKHFTESAAACFAAKEAFFKAAGRGLGGFELHDVAALRKESGAPYYELTGGAAEYLAQNSLRAHLSLTHDAGLAIAFAVLERQENEESA